MQIAHVHYLFVKLEVVRLAVQEAKVAEDVTDAVDAVRGSQNVLNAAQDVSEAGTVKECTWKKIKYQFRF